ncbi:MAG TPA: 50S ribosome-binding protein YggL [Gemmatimonadaceae bacterium]
MSPACPVFGFLIRVRLRAGTDADDFSRRLSEFLFSRALVVTGSLSALVVAGEGMQATDADRDAVLEWLVQRPDVAHADVGPLSDVGTVA